MKDVIPAEVVEQRKRDLKKLRERIDEKLGNAMRFYDAPIPEERRNELKTMVS